MEHATPPAANERVRAAIAAADRRRRRRAASTNIWRAAPIVAAASLLVAAVSRWAGWPSAFPLGVLAAALLALALYLLFSRRDRTISDAVAATIDTDAGLGGELRSASWFAGRDTRDGWANLHVDRAADRLRSVDWAQLYPPVRAPRARAATSLMVVATLALAIVFPDRPVDSMASARGNEVRLKPDSTNANALPPELQKQLEDLLAAAERGTLDIEGNPVSAVEMRELLDRLRQLRERAELKELAHAMNADPRGSSAQEMMALAERLRLAGEKNEASREFRKAVEDLARNLSEAASAEQAEAERARAAASMEGQQPGAGGQTSASTEIDEATIQTVKEAQSAAGGAGVVMMSNQEAPGGAASPGFGAGGSGSSTGEARMAEIEQALRQETIEANRDQAGANVDSEVRRKTEQGHATVTFTRGSSGKSDKSRAAAPAPVPEARRTDVQRYFIRKQ